MLPPRYKGRKKGAGACEQCKIQPVAILLTTGTYMHTMYLLTLTACTADSCRHQQHSSIVAP